MSRMRVSEHKAQMAAVKSTHITLTLTERDALGSLEGAPNAPRSARSHLLLTPLLRQPTSTRRYGRQEAPTMT